MSFLADGLLLLAAISAATYCAILSARLRRLTDTDGSLHAAISALNAEVDEMKSALEAAKTSTETAVGDLDLRIARATTASAALEDQASSASEIAEKISTTLTTADSLSGRAAVVADDIKRLIAEADEIRADLQMRRPDPQVETAAPIEPADRSVERGVAEKTGRMDGEDAAKETVPQPVEENDEVAPLVEQPAEQAVEQAAEQDLATLAETEVEPSSPKVEQAPDSVETEDAPGSPSSENLTSAAPAQTEPMQALLAMREAEDDSVFASRLVEALSNLEPKRTEEVVS